MRTIVDVIILNTIIILNAIAAGNSSRNTADIMTGRMISMITMGNIMTLKGIAEAMGLGVMEAE
jgi:hypothetical protein